MKYETFCKLSDEDLIPLVHDKCACLFKIAYHPVEGCVIDEELMEARHDIEETKIEALEAILKNKKLNESGFSISYTICSNAEKNMEKFDDRIKSILEMKKKKYKPVIAHDDWITKDVIERFDSLVYEARLKKKDKPVVSTDDLFTKGMIERIKSLGDE